MEIKPFHNEILDKKFTHKYRSGYVSINGYIFPKSFTKLVPKIADLEVYNNDVWVTSYPKTGTTWTQEMVWLIANDLDYQRAKEEYLDMRFPFLEFTGMFEVTKDSDDAEKRPPYLVDSIQMVQDMKQPRFIKSHLPWTLLPKQIQNGSKKPKIIHVVRNAKDTCVSYYHHMRLLEGYRGNFDEFCQLFLTNEINFSPFWKNISSYWEHHEEPNYLFLTYENMKNDLPGCLGKVAAFLGKHLSDEDVKKLNEHLSFNSMKKNPAVNKSDIVGSVKLLQTNIEGDDFIRAGKVGDYKNLMDEKKIQKFDKWIEENTKNLKPLF